MGTTARLSTPPMQTSERPNSPSIRRTSATGGTPESRRDRDASQNQRQLGLDGVTPPAAHCPRRLPPGLNQGGTSLGFFSSFSFVSSRRRVCFRFLSCFSDCPPPLQNFTSPPPRSPVAAFVSVRQPSKEDRRIPAAVGHFYFPFFVRHFPLSFNFKCLHPCLYSAEDFGFKRSSQWLV